MHYASVSILYHIAMTQTIISDNETFLWLIKNQYFFTYTCKFNITENIPYWPFKMFVFVNLVNESFSTYLWKILYQDDISTIANTLM